MNRKQLFGLLAFLFALPPLVMQAQTLTGYEYWFDGNVSGRVSESLSGDEAVINTTIETQHLSSGLHTLHLRFRQLGGEYEYSPVTSQVFFKHNADEGGKVEYWFDNDITKSATVSLPSEATKDTVNVALNMTDAIKFPLGFHQLSIRVSTEGKSLGSIYTAHVLKVPSGEIDVLEYWVDDDFDNRKTVEGHIVSSDENSHIFLNPFDLSGVPSGPHRIYYRPASKKGAGSGAVSMATVIVGGGTPSMIEYWFDNDVAHSAIAELPASAMTDTVCVALAMNDGEKFPLGLHQLSMRMVTKGREQSPVYSARVLKKASGKIDVLEYWVDDDFAHRRTITGKEASSNENAYVFNDSLNLNDVSEGFHRIYYRATSANGKANSAVCMTPVMVKSRYNVNPTDVKITKYSIAVDNEEPMVLNVPSPMGTTTIPYTLDARRFSTGNHTLTATFWNSLGLNVTEQSTFAVIEQETPTITLSVTEQDGYVKLSFNSIPNDVHYVVGRKDANGKAHKVYETYTSNYPNTISVVDNPVAGNYTYYVRAVYTDIEENKHGISSNEIPLAIKTHSAATSKGCIVGRVIFDEQEIDLISAIRMIYAEFSDGDEKVRIKPNGSFYRDGIPLGTKLTISIPDDDYYTYESVELKVTENTCNEVQIIKATHRTDNTVQVSNTNHDLVITSLRVKDSPDGFDLQVQNISGHTWRGYIKLIAVRTEDLEKETSSPKSVYQLSAFKTYYDAGSSYINYITNGEVQPVNIKITGIPVSENGDTYSFFIISNEKGKENSLKLLDCSNTISITNPFKQWVKGDEEFNYYGLRNELMFKDGVAEILSMMKKMDKGVGPFTFALNLIEDDMQQYEITHDSEGLFGKLPDILKSFSVDLKNAVDDVKEFTKIVGSAKKFYDYVKTFEVFNGDDYTAKFTKLSQIVTDWAFDGNPFAKIYSLYFETVEHAYNTANSWSVYFNDLNLAGYFDDHVVSIIVEVDGYYGNLLNSFSAKDVQEKIVKAELHMRQNDNWSHRVYTPQVSGADVFLKYAYDLPSDHKGFLPAVPVDEFYMDVFWEGDLVTPVWLLDESKVDYSLRTYRVKFKSSSSKASNMLEGLHWQPKNE